MLVSLGLLGTYTAWVTTQEGLDLLQVKDRDSAAGRPTKNLINFLQEERRVSLVFLSSKERGAITPGLQQQRSRTDQVITKWRQSVHKAPGEKIKRYITLTSQKLDALAGARSKIDTGGISRDSVAQAFNEAIDAALLVTSANAEVDDVNITADARALIALTRTREELSREDAYLAGVLAQGHFGPGEFTRFAQIVAVRDATEKDTAPQLPDADRRRLEDLQRGQAYRTFLGLEGRVLQPRTKGRPGVTAGQWQAATQPVLTQLDHAIDTGGDEVVQRATPLFIEVIAKWVLAGLFGVLAVVASAAMAITANRHLFGQLNRLKEAAQDLAENRLPDVMARLSKGEQVDVDAEAPPLQFGTDEIGQVGLSFNAVQRAAIDAAQRQAAQREASRRVLLDLGQRSRALMARQLTLIDAMERRRDLDTTQVKELFALDQLTVLGQRYVGNIVLLAGGRTTTAARRPAKMIDVIRNAIGKVEGYERVRIGQADDHYLSGYAIDDVSNLFAELIDNAVRYSPHEVGIESHLTASGLAVGIEDRGLGLDDEQLDQINEFLKESPEFLAAELKAGRHVQLGHFVVAIRARNHNIRVTLKRSPYGGVTAVVLLPHKLFTDPTSEPAAPPARSTAGVSAASASSAAPSGMNPEETGNIALLHKGVAPVASLTSVPDPLPASAEHTGADQATTSVSFTDEPARATEDPDPESRPETEPVADATENGLPVRRPQESLAAGLRTEVPLTDEHSDVGPEDLRDPEEIKKIMGSFQRGAERGRADATRMVEDQTDGASPHRPDPSPSGTGTEAATPDRDQ